MDFIEQSSELQVVHFSRFPRRSSLSFTIARSSTAARRSRTWRCVRSVVI